MMKEYQTWTCHAFVEKWDSDQTLWVAERTGLAVPDSHAFEALHVKPYETVDGPTPGNLLVTVGLDEMTDQLIGTAIQPWDNTHSGLGVGNSSTGEGVGDTDLLGASKYYKAEEATYPTAVNGVITFKSSYGSGVAEFAWNEYGAIVPGQASTTWADGATKPVNFVLLNRKVASLGTKGAGSTWTLTMTLTIS